jgi:hypothetical protein
VYPENKIIQGTVANGDEVYEGSGSLIANHSSPISLSNFSISKTYTIPLDLSPSVIGVSEAAISIQQWIGKETITGRMDLITFETSYDNHFSFDPQPWNYTRPIGWNQEVLPLSLFTVTGAPDWSNITKITISTTVYNDQTPTDVIFDDLRLIEYLPPGLDQIASFDNVSVMGLSIWPLAGWVGQGTSPGDPVYEGDGSLKVDYEGNFNPDPNFSDHIVDWYFNWYPPLSLDLDGSVIGGDPNNTAISFWMWVGKDTLTARVVDIKFSTAYYNSEFEYIFPDTTYDIGWNQVLIPLNDFGTSSSTVTDPTWSSIEWIAIHTSSDPDVTPTDVVIDDMRLVSFKCNKYDVDGDCGYDLVDFAIEVPCWQIDCSPGSTPGHACCVGNDNSMDVDGDGDYDMDDLALEVSGWLVDCLPSATPDDPSCE